MSSRSQALFRSITEVKHVLRQHHMQFNQHSRRSYPLFFGPEMVLENSFCVAVGMGRWWGRRYQYRELLELDDRLLADIGISRTVVEEIRKSSLYERAWRDSK
jgi:uncharacterized protein YjiS (DUF1127 family)